MKRPKPSSVEKRQMRVRGYEDGLAGRPARYTDLDYQRSWKHGLERRKQVTGK